MAVPGKIRVFIVEDSTIFVQAIMNLIGEIEGIEVVGSAGDAGQAKEGILRLNPDVVILDIQIAGGSGLDVLKDIKSRSCNAAIAIVYSSEAEPGYRRACVKLGADFVFDKSQDYEALFEVLRSMGASARSGSGQEDPRVIRPEMASGER